MPNNFITFAFIGTPQYTDNQPERTQDIYMGPGWRVNNSVQKKKVRCLGFCDIVCCSRLDSTRFVRWIGRWPNWHSFFFFVVIFGKLVEIRCEADIFKSIFFVKKGGCAGSGWFLINKGGVSEFVLSFAVKCSSFPLAMPFCDPLQVWQCTRATRPRWG